MAYNTGSLRLAVVPFHPFAFQRLPKLDPRAFATFANSFPKQEITYLNSGGGDLSAFPSAL